MGFTTEINSYSSFQFFLSGCRSLLGSASKWVRFKHVEISCLGCWTQQLSNDCTTVNYCKWWQWNKRDKVQALWNMCCNLRIFIEDVIIKLMFWCVSLNSVKPKGIQRSTNVENSNLLRDFESSENVRNWKKNVLLGKKNKINEIQKNRKQWWLDNILILLSIEKNPFSLRIL